jgi:hypothetical protein
MRWLLAATALLAVSGGCTYIAATPSVQGRAYVIRNEYVSSSFWNCDATGGEPVCYQTKKQFTQQPAAK